MPLIKFVGLFFFTLQASASTNADLVKLESQYKIHIGIFAQQGEKSLGFRESERFAYCSVFKWILCADLLKMSNDHKLDLKRELFYDKKDILKYSPVTLKHLPEGRMTVHDLCEATITTSDNTAAMLLSPLVGNTSGLQSFVRSLGDETTRFDRSEPALSLNEPHDERDTTSPKAMTKLLSDLLSGPTLNEPSRSQLLNWLKATTTGADRIRAGVPKNWLVGDKTGTGDHGAANDVAVLFPPTGQPIYLSVFTSGDGTDLAAHEKAIAEAVKLVFAEFN